MPSTAVEHWCLPTPRCPAKWDTRGLPPVQRMQDAFHRDVPSAKDGERPHARHIIATLRLFNSLHITELIEQLPCHGGLSAHGGRSCKGSHDSSHAVAIVTVRRKALAPRSQKRFAQPKAASSRQLPSKQIPMPTVCQHHVSKPRQGLSAVRGTFPNRSSPMRKAIVTSPQIFFGRSTSCVTMPASMPSRRSMTSPRQLPSTTMFNTNVLGVPAGPAHPGRGPSTFGE